MLDFFLLLVNKAHKNSIASFVVTVKEVKSNLETHTQWRSPAAVSHTVVLFICTYCTSCCGPYSPLPFSSFSLSPLSLLPLLLSLSLLLPFSLSLPSPSFRLFPSFLFSPSPPSPLLPLSSPSSPSPSPLFPFLPFSSSPLPLLLPPFLLSLSNISLKTRYCPLLLLLVPESGTRDPG